MTTKYLLVYVALVLVVLISPCSACKDEVCEYVNAHFEPCEKFVAGFTSCPTYKCCNNLIILNDSVKKENDGVRKYCSCIVNFSNSHDHPPYLQDRIEQLHTLCDVHLSFPISERMNCSKYFHKLSLVS
ncbi:putative early nodulin-like protein 2-like, partial [Capsicum annuum]